MSHVEGCVCFRCEVDAMTLGQAAFFCQDQADAHRLAGRDRLADAWDKRKVRLFEIQGHIRAVGNLGGAE